MKQIKFESNNKQWLVVDEKDLPKIDQLLIAKDSKFVKLSEITEEQVSELVDIEHLYEREENNCCIETNFLNEIINYSIPKYKYTYKGKMTVIESLYSLLKSKGVDDSWINPVIFEIIK